MKTTDAFEFCEIINGQNFQSKQDYLTQKIRSLHDDFAMIIGDTKTFKDILNKIHTTVDKVELPYLYFLPNVSQVRHFFFFFYYIQL